MARRPSQDRQQMHGQMFPGQVYNNGMYQQQPQVYGQPVYYSGFPPQPAHHMQTYYRPATDGTAAVPFSVPPPPTHVMPQMIGQTPHYVQQAQNPMMGNPVQMYNMQMVPTQNAPVQFHKPYMVPTTTHIDQLTDQVSLTSLDAHQQMQQQPPVEVPTQPPPMQYQQEQPPVQSPQPAEKAPTPLNSLNTNHEARQKQPSPLSNTLNGQKEFVNQSYASHQNNDWQQHIRTDADRDRRHRDNISRSSQGSTMQRPRHDRRSPPQRTQDARRQQPPAVQNHQSQSWRRDMPPQPAPPPPKQPPRPYLKECTYCMNLGKAFNECCTHTVVDPITHIVMCPELRKVVCSECGATGEQAHDSHFCPQQADVRSKKHADMEKVARLVKQKLVGKNMPPPRSLAAAQVGEPMRKHSQQSSGGGGGRPRHHAGDRERGHGGGYAGRRH